MVLFYQTRIDFGENRQFFPKLGIQGRRGSNILTWIGEKWYFYMRKSIKADLRESVSSRELASAIVIDLNSLVNPLSHFPHST